MKTKTKRIIVTTICTAVVVALAVWHTLPILGYRAFIKPKVPNVVPTRVDALPDAPDEWEQIEVGGLKMTLPLSECQDISGSENPLFLNFWFDSYVFSVNFNGQMEEKAAIPEQTKEQTQSYQEALKIANSKPSDVSIFNLPSKNRDAAFYQSMKGLIGNRAYEINIVESSRTLKAICWKKTTEKQYMASGKIYDQSENSRLHIIVKGCEDKETLDAILFNILGGLHLPQKELAGEKLRQDIRRISKSQARDVR